MATCSCEGPSLPLPLSVTRFSWLGLHRRDVLPACTQTLASIIPSPHHHLLSSVAHIRAPYRRSTRLILASSPRLDFIASKQPRSARPALPHIAITRCLCNDKRTHLFWLKRHPHLGHSSQALLTGLAPWTHGGALDHRLAHNAATVQ